MVDAVAASVSSLLASLWELNLEGRCPSRGDVWGSWGDAPPRWPEGEIVSCRRGWGWEPAARAARPLLLGAHSPAGPFTVALELVADVWAKTGCYCWIMPRTFGGEGPQVYRLSSVCELRLEGCRPKPLPRQPPAPAPPGPDPALAGRLTLRAGDAAVELEPIAPFAAGAPRRAGVYRGAGRVFKLFRAKPLLLMPHAVPPAEWHVPATAVVGAVEAGGASRAVWGWEMPELAPAGRVAPAELRGIVEFLRGFHARGYAHLDINRNNIMRLDGAPVLIDFDSAIVLEGGPWDRPYTRGACCVDCDLIQATSIFEHVDYSCQVFDLIELAVAAGMLAGEADPFDPVDPVLAAWLRLACAEPLEPLAAPDVYDRLLALL